MQSPLTVDVRREAGSLISGLGLLAFCLVRQFVLLGSSPFSPTSSLDPWGGDFLWGCYLCLSPPSLLWPMHCGLAPLTQNTFHHTIFKVESWVKRLRELCQGGAGKTTSGTDSLEGSCRVSEPIICSLAGCCVPCDLEVAMIIPETMVTFAHVSLSFSLWSRVHCALSPSRSQGQMCQAQWCRHKAPSSLSLRSREKATVLMLKTYQGEFLHNPCRVKTKVPSLFSWFNYYRK